MVEIHLKYMTHWFDLFRKGELHLDPGEYNYNFQVQLPMGIPTSLEAQIGHIRYGLQVVLARPLWPDQKFEKTFTVIKPLNLNHDITLRVNNFKMKYFPLRSHIKLELREQFLNAYLVLLLFFVFVLLTASSC